MKYICRYGHEISEELVTILNEMADDYRKLIFNSKKNGTPCTKYCESFDKIQYELNNIQIIKE